MSTPQKTPLKGIFTPNLVPFDEAGDINEAELRRYVDWLIARGVHGLYPNGSTGEFTRLTAEERRRITGIVIDQAAGRVPVLAGAAEANTRETIKACEAYADMGVRAVAIVAPYYFKLTPDAVYAYFREIARNSPADVTLYNIPAFASPVDVPTVRRLADEFDRVVGIKDSTGDVPHMIRLIQAVRPNRPDFSFLTGWEAALMPMLLIGCDGGTNASSGIVPEVTRRLYEASLEGRINEARKIQFDLIQLFDLMLYHSEFPDGFRAAASLRGFHMGRGRQPLSEKQTESLDALRDSLQCLLWELGFTDQPVGGCPCPHDTPSTDSRDDVSEIVKNVVTELRKRGLVT